MKGAKRRIRELLDYADTHPDLITTIEQDNLVKLNYTRKTDHGNKRERDKYWNRYTRMCRGIIINRETLDVVAYPFNKFF